MADEANIEVPDPPGQSGLDPPPVHRLGGQEPPPDPTEAFWDAMGDEGRAIREGKKWNDPADLAKGYRAEQQARTKAEQERAALLQYVEAMEQQAEAAKVAAPQQPQQGPQETDWKAMAEGLRDPETGEHDMAQVLQMAAVLGAQMSYGAAVEFIKNELAQFTSTELAPIKQDFEVNQLAEELGAVEATYGEQRFDALTEKIEELADAGEDLVAELGARRAYAEMAARMSVEEEERKQREADGYTLTGGGRRAPQRRMTQEQIEVAAMERLYQRPNDGLRMHIRLRLG